MTERVAIVTGASGGIGHAVAVRLGQADSIRRGWLGRPSHISPYASLAE